MTRLSLFAFLLIPALLSACASAPSFSGKSSRQVSVDHITAANPADYTGNPGVFKVGKPYKIFGKLYRPKEDYNLIETGIASWYGPNFDGKPTANGETFDMRELTAAHRTLHMPSLVRVTNLENGKSLVVRVNDRGPFKRGRVIDLSKRAAELLGFKNKGTAKVRLQVLTEESKRIAEIAKSGRSTARTELALNQTGQLPATDTPRVTAEPTNDREEIQTVSLAPPPSVSAPVERVELAAPSLSGQVASSFSDPVVQSVPVVPTNIFVQAGAFSSADNAAALAQRLSVISEAKVYPTLVNGQQFYRVRFPAGSVGQADQILQKMLSSGNADALIIVE